MTSAIGATRNRRNRSPRNRRHRGFSLFELLLVLALLAAVALMVVPAISHALSKRSLRTGADQIRRVMTEVRRRAIDEGVPMKFEYEPGMPDYVVSQLFDISTTEDAAPFTSTDDRHALFGALVDGLVFCEPLEPDLSSQSETLGLYFYPDGTADDGIVVIEDKAGQWMQISLRGLTGTVSTGKIQQEGSR